MNLDIDSLDIGDDVYFPVYRVVHKKYVTRKNPKKYEIYHGHIVEICENSVIIRTKNGLFNRSISKIASNKQQAKKIEL